MSSNPNVASPLGSRPTLTLVDYSDSGAISLSVAEILAVLSRALDLTEGQPMGHAVRSAVIGMRIGVELGLEVPRLQALHHALLMKDAGCSSNAAKMFAIFGGDEITAKRDAKIVDWSRVTEAVKYGVSHTLPGESFVARTRKLLSHLGRGEKVMDALIQARCSRGAQIALTLGLGEEAAAAIHALDEHWDGQGAAQGQKGEEIPILARILCLAQTIEVFFTTFGAASALQVAARRSGTWFDPQLSQIVSSWSDEDSFWQQVRITPETLLRDFAPPENFVKAAETTVDAICDAFAQIVDAKSSFTGEHSSRVCAYALEIATEFGIPGERRRTLRRAGLLHDLGKLAVPNLILDKPGKLTDDEFAVIRRHPFHTAEILGALPGFERITAIAAAHHEKLNGRGYFRGLTAEHLDLDMRILAVADVYDALSAARPYRGALPLEQVFAILDQEADSNALDADCIAALKNVATPQKVAA